MLKYFIIFSLIGLGVALLIDNPKKGFAVIMAISFLWGLSSQPIWGLVTAGELLIGFVIGKLFVKR